MLSIAVSILFFAFFMTHTSDVDTPKWQATYYIYFGQCAARLHGICVFECFLMKPPLLLGVTFLFTIVF